MGCTVRIHHPDLTAEEREKRVEKIKEALVCFYKEVEKEKKGNGKRIFNG